MTATKRSLSDRAVRLLRALIAFRDREGHPASLSELESAYGPATPSLLESLHVLANRQLVVITPDSIEPRRRGRDLLKQSHYRSMGI